MVEHLIGKAILEKPEKQPGLLLSLLVGLLILTIAIHLPFIGGAFNLIATLLGLGLMLQLWLNRDKEAASD